MFKRTSYAFIGLWALVIAIGAYYFLNVGEDDLVHFRNLHNHAKPNSGEERGKQQKNGVIKELWVMKEGIPHHIRLESDAAELTVERKEMRSNISEKMNNLVCAVQEKVSPEENWQMIEVIEADYAIYFYRTDSFKADQVTIKRYKIPGIELPNTFDGINPVMKGFARQVEFKILADGLDLKASNITAELDP
ncbi:MAG: hypothetical protein ACK4HV_06700 [Parachlamydiaceae bacterium]